MVVGGFGGGISVEVATIDTVCANDQSQPSLPIAPSGTIEGWVRGRNSQLYHIFTVKYYKALLRKSIRFFSVVYGCVPLFIE